MTRTTTTHPGTKRALAAAARRGDWERLALYLLLGASLAARSAPRATIDDVVALLAGEDDGDERD